MDPGLDGLGNSQPSKMAKDTRMKRFTLRRACSREDREGCGCITFWRYLGRSEVTGESTLGDLSRRNAWPCRSQAEVGPALAGLQSRWHSRAFLPEALGEDLFLCLFCRAEAVCIPLLMALPPSAQPATLHLSDPFSRCDCVGATWTSQGSLPIARSAHQQPDFSLPCNVTFTGSGDSGVAIFGGPSCCLS